jgi:hypothetical protein
MELQGQAGSLMDELRLVSLPTSPLRAFASPRGPTRSSATSSRSWYLQLPATAVDKGIPFKDIPTGAPGK